MCVYAYLGPASKGSAEQLDPASAVSLKIYYPHRQNIARTPAGPSRRCFSEYRFINIFDVAQLGPAGMGSAKLQDEAYFY